MSTGSNAAAAAAAAENRGEKIYKYDMKQSFDRFFSKAGGPLADTLTSQQYSFLFRGKASTYAQDIHDLLSETNAASSSSTAATSSQFDPVLEAYRLFSADVDEPIGRDTIGAMLHAVGFKDVVDEDIDAVVREVTGQPVKKRKKKKKKKTTQQTKQQPQNSTVAPAAAAATSEAASDGKQQGSSGSNRPYARRLSSGDTSKLMTVQLGGALGKAAATVQDAEEDDDDDDDDEFEDDEDAGADLSGFTSSQFRRFLPVGNVMASPRARRGRSLR
jgi:hypothetical protein